MRHKTMGSKSQALWAMFFAMFFAAGLVVAPAADDPELQLLRNTSKAFTRVVSWLLAPVCITINMVASILLLHLMTSTRARWSFTSK